MIEDILHLDILALQAFAEVRNPLLDQLFWLATELGHEPFLILFGAIGLWFVDKDIFRRALLMLLVSALLNAFLKEYFALPRPTVTAVYTAEGYSFPSGHAQTAAAFWGWLAFEFRHRRFLATLMFIVAILVALSRPYLGVHHFHDVGVGLFLGFLQVGLFSFCINSKHKNPSAKDWTLAGIGSFLITTACFFYFENPEMKKLAIVLSALITSWLFGVLIDQRFIEFTPPRNWKSRVLTFIIGIVVLLLLWRGLKPVFQEVGFDGAVADYIRYLLTGLWFAAGLPFISKQYLQRSGAAHHTRQEHL